MSQNLRKNTPVAKNNDSPGTRGLPEISAYGGHAGGLAIDRLGRSLGNLVQLTNELQSRRIDLESLTEKLDTGSPTGKLVFHVFAAHPC
jgi:Resolvase, N terminal domain